MAAYVPIQFIVHYAVAAAAIHANANAGVEGKIIGRYIPVIALRKHQRALPAGNDIILYDGLVAIAQVHGGAITQPLIFFILMIAHPVTDVFFFLRAVQSLAVIIAEVTMINRQSFYIYRHDGNFITPCLQVLDRNIFSPLLEICITFCVGLMSRKLLLWFCNRGWISILLFPLQ